MAQIEILTEQPPDATGNHYMLVRVSFLDYSFDQNVVLTTTDFQPILLIYADEYEQDFLRNLGQ